ncbi:unannotated protein [freshwater metagenome]|uniref:Unannotated protein n=1 Tax=freshwater metagenome TaxID=449393 RepID=A0A6J7GFT0_9ZZZZ
MKRTGLMLLSIIALVSAMISPTYADSIPDEQWIAPLPADVLTTPYLGFLADGIGAAPNSGDSYLLGQEADGTSIGKSNVLANRWCKAVTDPECAKVTYFKYSATLGFCSTTVTNDCITSVEAFDETGKALAVNKVKSFSGTKYQPFTGFPTKGIPNGAAAEIVDIPGAPHSGGTQYLIDVHNDGSWITGSDKSLSKSFNAQIFGIKLGPAPAGADKAFQTTAVYAGQKLGDNPKGGDVVDSSCVVYSAADKACALGYTMPLDVTFRINIKTSIYIMGWFHGRISNASTSFNLDQSGAARVATISFSGNPVVVPTYSAWSKSADLPAAITAFNSTYPKRVSGTIYGSKSKSSTDKKPGDEFSGGISLADAMSIQLRAKEYDQASIDQLNIWIASFGDTASSSPTRWIYQSMDISFLTNSILGASGQGASTQQPPQSGSGQQPPQGGSAPAQPDKSSECYIKSGGDFSGVVSTNATQYISGPPTFDVTNQSLDYKVAAPHYLANGKEFQGSYNLEISDTLARCLYGFTDAPVAATVSVVGVNGESKVSTTTMRAAGGFLRLSATGFTFSSPTIRVKLSQPTTTSTSATAATTTSTKTTTAATAPTKVASKTISCVKGKTVKKVSGVSPKCPTGYKLKK